MVEKPSEDYRIGDPREKRTIEGLVGFWQPPNKCLSPKQRKERNYDDRAGTGGGIHYDGWKAFCINNYDWTQAPKNIQAYVKQWPKGKIPDPCVC